MYLSLSNYSCMMSNYHVQITLLNNKKHVDIYFWYIINIWGILQCQPFPFYFFGYIRKGKERLQPKETNTSRVCMQGGHWTWLVEESLSISTPYLARTSAHWLASRSNMINLNSPTMFQQTLDLLENAPDMMKNFISSIHQVNRLKIENHIHK